MTLASGCNTGRQTAPHPLARYRSEFPIFRDRIYLNTCSLGALGERTRRRVAEFLDVWDARGAAAWYDVWWAALAELRARYAGVIGATAEEIALPPRSSVALPAVAEAFDYTRRPKVVVTSLDFPTVAYQWLAKRARGVELVVVESPDHVSVPVEAIARAVDERTALVATSHVYFTSGAIQDIRAVAHAAHVRGALCLIDAYQSVGQVPCDVRAADVDFLTAGGLKWLLGRPGGRPLGDRDAPRRRSGRSGAPSRGGGNHRRCATRSRPPLSLFLQRAGRLCRSTRAARSTKRSLRMNDSSPPPPVSAVRSRRPTRGGCCVSWGSSSKGSTRSRTCTMR